MTGLLDGDSSKGCCRSGGTISIHLSIPVIKPSAAMLFNGLLYALASQVGTHIIYEIGISNQLLCLLILSSPSNIPWVH